MRTLALLALIGLTFAGCLGDDTVRVAFVAKDTATAPHEDLDALAAWIEQHTGRPTTVDLFTSSTAALQAVKSGQADIASVDGAAAWLAWQTLGLEAAASEVRADGRTHYVAAGWTVNGTGITKVRDFEGANSCHTGATKSAGMLIPISFLISKDLIDPTQYADDITVVQDMAHDFFGTATIGGAYEGYEGALRCLSEGVGDVAFIRDTTPADYCDEAGAATRDWCLPLDAYQMVRGFGPVPEHPLMVRDVAAMADVVAALEALDDSAEGQAILAGTFGTGQIRAVTTQDHLGDYGALIEHLPGITKYAQAQ